MSIYERLLLLETKIKFFANILSDGVSIKDVKKTAELFNTDLQGFNNLKLVDSDEFPIPEDNSADHSKGHTLYKHVKFESEKTIIINRSDADGQQKFFLIILLRQGEHRNKALIGEINSDYLWEIGNKEKLPFMTELTVINRSGELLYTSISEPHDLIKKLANNKPNSSWGQFTWNHKGEQYLAKSRELFLHGRFSEKGWIFVLSQSKSDVLSGVRKFRAIFPLFLLLSFLIVLFFSSKNIKKQLEPLYQLKKGTQLIAKGNFTNKITIDSGNEFEDLAYSFNKMSEELYHQFNNAKLIAEIGRTSTKFSSIKRYVDEIIKIFVDYHNYDRGMFLLADKEKRNFHYAGGTGYSHKEIRYIEKIYLNLKTTQSWDLKSSALMDKKPFLDMNKTISQSKCLKYLDKTNELNIKGFCVCSPLLYNKETIGILILESIQSKKIDKKIEEEFLESITPQLAVSISNNLSYKKLLESEKRFRKVFDYAASGIALIDLNGKLLKVNKLLTRMIGMSDEVLCGKTLKELSHPDDYNTVSVSQSKLIKGQIDFDTIEQRFFRSNGHVCWSLVSTSLLRSSNGIPLYFISIIKDLTDQKKVKKEKNRLEARLQQAQKLEAIGTLARGIAHDFNNILSGIMGYAQLGMIDNKKDGKIYSRFEGILEACDRATDLVKQILTFSRQHKQEKAPIQLSTIIKEALKLLKATLPPDINIIQNISNESGVVLADATQIHQIVMNLCTNAYHAMLDKGGTLEVNLTHEKLILPTITNKYDLEPQAYLKLTVSDTGCGIDKSIIKKIFDPYFTTKKSSEGTGLGLSVVHGIIESHGGTITVQSELGKGTIFEVFLPTIASDTLSENTNIEIPSTGNERILYVDDEETVAAVGKLILERLGYRIAAFTDPHNALCEFRAHSSDFDLVITDLLMPNLTGKELAKNIREIRPDIPILFCTGNNANIAAENINMKEMRGVLMKPLEINKLSKTIRKMLDKNLQFF